MDLKKQATEIPLCLALSPAGHLHLHEGGDERLSSAFAGQIRSFFKPGEASGLLRLGLLHFDNPLPSSFSFWRQFAEIFVSSLCKHSDPSQVDEVSMPTAEIKGWIQQAPFIRGIEYLTLDVARDLWSLLSIAMKKELIPFAGKLEAYLETFHTAWQTVGRVCFHLAENKNNAKAPFAFLATYTTGLSQSTQTQHLPLGRALEEYAGGDQKERLLKLLLPVQKAAEKSNFLKNLVDTGAVFKPLPWKPQDAYQFLNDLPLFESAGVMVRVPNWWNTKKPPRPRIAIAMGEKNMSKVGLDALLDFNMSYTLPDGEQLTLEELKKLMKSEGPLVQIKGQWVQVEADQLEHVLSHWQRIQQRVRRDGLSFAEGLRLLAGIPEAQAGKIVMDDTATWSTVTAGTWLHDTLQHLRHPQASGEQSIAALLKKQLKATLRPYQAKGMHWLWWLYQLRLGGCLADDMGLGKTIQVIALLLAVKNILPTRPSKEPHLLILPTSLLGNWEAEIHRFAPTLRV